MKSSALLLLYFFLFSNPLMAQEVKHITPKLYKLGRIQEGTVLKDTLRFVNNGKKPVTIKRVRSSCGCTTTTLAKKEIAAGDTGAVGFTLNTRGYKSVLRKTITVVFEEKKIKPLEFKVHTVVYTNWEVTPRYLHFYRIPVNPDTTLLKVLTIENHSEHTINVKEIDTGSPKISVSPESGEIKAGNKLFIQVQMVPDKVGTLHETMTILSDDEHKPKIKVPIYMHVTE